LKVNILKLNEPTVNGRIYREENLTLKEKGFVYVCDSEQDLSKCIGTFSNLHVKDDHLVCDVEFMDTPMGNLLKPFMQQMIYTSVGLGKLDRDGVVKEYKMSHVAVINA
jgi:hypothetical protein